MKLTISRLTLLLGLIIFVDFLFFDNFTHIYYVPILFIVFTILGILNRKSEKPYTYGRGLLIGFRILLLGIICSLLFLLIASVIKIFISLVNPNGKSITESTKDGLMFLANELGYHTPSLIAILVFSLIPMFVIPLFFLRKSKQMDDIIDADLMDNGKK